MTSTNVHEVRFIRALRQWRLSGEQDALRIFGCDEVTRWLAPSVGKIADISPMRSLLSSWISLEGASPPVGQWAIVDRGDVVGSEQIIALPPEDGDLLDGYENHPSRGDRDVGAEATHALAPYAFENGQDEIFRCAHTK